MSCSTTSRLYVSTAWSAANGSPSSLLKNLRTPAVITYGALVFTIPANVKMRLGAPVTAHLGASDLIVFPISRKNVPKPNQEQNDGRSNERARGGLPCCQEGD